MAQLYEVQTVWTGVAGSPFYTTHRGLQAGTLGAQGMADAWEDFLTAINSVTDNNLVAVIQPDVRVIESTTGETQAVLSITGATVSMTSSADSLPKSTQFLCRWTTNVFTSGRQIRGRTFIPGQTETNNAIDGKPTGALVGQYQILGDAFISDCGGDFVIYSPTHRTYAAVQACSPWTEWAELRSRRD